MSEYARTDPLDSQALLRAVDSDLPLLQELIALFFADGRKGVTEIQEALWASDVETIRFAAHRLRGSAAVFGQTSFHRLAHAIELGAQGGSLAEVRELTKDLEIAFQHLSDALSGVLEELTRPT